MNEVSESDSSISHYSISFLKVLGRKIDLKDFGALYDSLLGFRITIVVDFLK